MAPRCYSPGAMQLFFHSQSRDLKMIDNAAALDSHAKGGSPTAMIRRFKEYEAILGRNCMGRIAFAVGERVSVLPVQYVYTGGWIYGRTTVTPQIRRLLRNRRIAFEVDEHNSLLEWRSVVVRGPLYPIDAAMASAGGLYARAVAVIRRLLPGQRAASTSAEESNDQLFRIRVIEVSGRASEPERGGLAKVSTLQDLAG